MLCRPRAALAFPVKLAALFLLSGKGRDLAYGGKEKLAKLTAGLALAGVPLEDPSKEEGSGEAPLRSTITLHTIRKLHCISLLH